MLYDLCIAEKPSVAKDIARVLGAKESANGYYHGNGYIVTWAIGHLVGLAEPDAYGFVKQEDMYKDEASKAKAYAELPLVPDVFKLIVYEKTKPQFAIIKELMHRKDVKNIIDCGDMGAEGHILQWFIREKAGNTKPVKRFCATSMTDEAILNAMNNLKDANVFLPIIKGEFCKKKEDWILGISLSRALSIKYNAGLNVGRVQSPTLGFIVKRFLEVSQFRPVDFFTLDATVFEGDGFHVYWNKDTEDVFPINVKTEDGKVTNKEFVDHMCELISNTGKGIISDLKTERKATNRPQLYDITELQRDANIKYGYTAAFTLSVAQSLYETHKVLSYPRTDSRYITSDLIPYMKERVEMIGTIAKYKSVAASLVREGINIDKRICDDRKVTDHHALIPTENISGFDLAGLKPSDDEKEKGISSESLINILDLVLCRMLVSFSGIYKYEQSSIVVDVDQKIKLSATGIKPIDLGWKSLQDALLGKTVTEEAEPDNQVFPSLQIGQVVRISDCKTLAKKTVPPKLHTEATLLTAMENAGQYIEDGSILKGKGIGTQATRAEIIKKLFDTSFVELFTKGKTPFIKPTQKGLNIIRVLPPELYSPQITADWELKIADIVEGKLSEEQVMKEFEDYIHQLTDMIMKDTVDVSFAKEKESFGDCPWCGKAVYRFQEKNEKGKVQENRYYCSEKCNWGLKDMDITVLTRTGKKLTEAEVKRFISKKSIILDCIAKGKGNKYKGEFTFYERVSNGKHFCNVKCVPVKPKK